MADNFSTFASRFGGRGKRGKVQEDIEKG